MKFHGRFSSLVNTQERLSGVWGLYTLFIAQWYKPHLSAGVKNGQFTIICDFKYLDLTPLQEALRRAPLPAVKIIHVILQFPCFSIISRWILFNKTTSGGSDNKPEWPQWRVHKYMQVWTCSTTCLCRITNSWQREYGHSAFSLFHAIPNPCLPTT